MSIIIKYRDEDGEEHEFPANHAYLLQDAGDAAEAIAEEDYRKGDLNDPDSWPREYEVFHEGEWMEVRVDMDYSPNFYGTVAKEAKG